MAHSVNRSFVLIDPTRSPAIFAQRLASSRGRWEKRSSHRRETDLSPCDQSHCRSTNTPHHTSDDSDTASECVASPHGAWTNWDREVEFSVIAICPTLLNQTTQELMQREIELIPQFSIDDPVIQQLALALKTEIQTGCMSGKLYGESLGIALAARLVQNYAVTKPSLEFRTNGLPQSQLKRVIDYMKANLTQDLSILNLATLISMSESHFSRSFKKSVGISPYQYLVQQRVERAKQLLEQRSIAISTIALNCGFANQTHFTKVFRQVTGVTPKAYQKR